MPGERNDSFERQFMMHYPATAVVILFLVLSGFCHASSTYSFLLAEPLPQADRVVVNKGVRTLKLMKQGEVIKSYQISLGRQPFGHKQREGDYRTPEGTYLIDWRNPTSLYHLSLHISYPGTQDRGKAERGGYSPGGAIMIHGRPIFIGSNDILFNSRDWTDGCIAVTNAEIEEIWRAVPDGTPITILP
jgi:murein L,D-transpeptidase YafK